MRGSRKPMGVVVSWVRRQPPKVKAFLAVVAGMAALVFICFIVNDHDNLFVAAEAAHALGIAVLVYKLTKEKTCAASGTRQGLRVHEAPGLPSLVGRGDCTEVSELNIAFPDVNADDRVVDEGTLCWNLLSSRLFFDAKMSDEINKAIKAHIQRTLSNMRTPSLHGRNYTC